MERLNLGPMCALTSVRHVANEGRRMTMGGKERGTPAYVAEWPSVGMDAPAIRRRFALSASASLSAVPAHSGGRPLEAFAAASWILFLTGEKHSHRSICVKPTGASGGRSMGKSCIIHSRRVALLKRVLLSSAYFGLTNSLTTPCLDSSVSRYRLVANTRQLMLPGKGECPVAGSATSPEEKASVERRRGSSWLYSTLTVTVLLPSLCSSRQMPPTASPGVRGTQTELMSNEWDADTPRTAGRARKMIPFVSWKKTTHLIPWSCHLRTVPD
mmetsp:Transcript_23287/g.54103  ORF Transcript_23287/g.54103 Transcript_23287/m.54103 type:complete len:271 (-) Transcript_23287:707-1519(-)